MDKPTPRQIQATMRILKKLGLTLDEICAICSALETKKMLVDMVARLKAKDFKLTQRETMNICGQVLEEYLT